MTLPRVLISMNFSQCGLLRLQKHNNLLEVRQYPRICVARLPVLHQAHFIVDEMLMNGSIVETNKQSILAPIQLLEKAS